MSPCIYCSRIWLRKPIVNKDFFISAPLSGADIRVSSTSLSLFFAVYRWYLGNIGHGG